VFIIPAEIDRKQNPDRVLDLRVFDYLSSVL
jgi:hypothetical protein